MTSLRNLDGLSSAAPTIEDLTIADAWRLTDLSGLAGLDGASLDIQGAESLTSLDGLAPVARLQTLSVVGPKLQRVDLPSLASAGEIHVGGPELVLLRMPSLVEVDELRITGNRLPRCHVTDLVAQLVANGWTGTPIVDNGPTCYDLDWCRLQAPLDAAANVGDVVDVSGRLYAEGLTDLGDFVNNTAVVVAEVGLGAPSTDPATDASWRWWTAPPTHLWSGAANGEPNNDEYTAHVSLDAAGSFDIAVRFSGDRGRTWLYCDRNAGAGADGSEDGYQPAHAGHLTVN